MLMDSYLQYLAYFYSLTALAGEWEQIPNTFQILYLGLLTLYFTF